jgi:hypothetical protein
MSDLLHLEEIFEKLKRGYHIAPDDNELFDALKADPAEYQIYFGRIGLQLIHHERDFFYFDSEESDTDSRRLAKIAIFSFILIDHLSTQGQPIEEAVFRSTFLLRDLPHFQSERYVSLLRQLEVTTWDHLAAIVTRMDKIGWAQWLDSEEFQLRRPFHRVLTKCLDLSRQAPAGIEGTAESPTEEPAP